MASKYIAFIAFLSCSGWRLSQRSHYPSRALAVINDIKWIVFLVMWASNHKFVMATHLKERILSYRAIKNIMYWIFKLIIPTSRQLKMMRSIWAYSPKGNAEDGSTKSLKEWVFLRIKVKQMLFKIISSYFVFYIWSFFCVCFSLRI